MPENKKHKSEAMKLYVRTPEHCANISKVHQKPVVQLDLQDNVIAEFPSAIAAEVATGVSRTKICVVCKGVRPRAGGYHWRYKVSE